MHEVQEQSTELEITRVLHALSDPVRLDLVRQLREADSPIACGHFDATVAKSTLSHHFKILREAGITSTHRSGANVLNELEDEALDEAFPGLLAAIFHQQRPRGSRPGRA